MSTVQLTIPAVGVSEAEMQIAFYQAHSQRYELVATNLYLGWCGGEMDIFGMRKSGFVDEAEIKLSASDFKADFKKTVRVNCDPYTPENTFIACSHPQCAKCRGTGKLVHDYYLEKIGDPCGYQTNYGELTTIDVLKHDALKDGRHSCNYFSFYLPIELMDKCEIPDHAGLYVFDATLGRWDSSKIKEIKKPPRLHSRKISAHNKYHTARKMHYRYWDIRLEAHRK